MKRKFYDGQWVRVIGADWKFHAMDTTMNWESSHSWWCENEWFAGCWPEYLLESAE